MDHYGIDCRKTNDEEFENRRDRKKKTRYSFSQKERFNLSTKEKILEFPPGRSVTRFWFGKFEKIGCRETGSQIDKFKLYLQKIINYKVTLNNTKYYFVIVKKNYN